MNETVSVQITNYDESPVKVWGIVVWNDNDIDKAIRTFKKKVTSSGLLKELKRASFAATRTQRRKEKDQFSLRRLKRSQRRQKRGSIGHE